MLMRFFCTVTRIGTARPRLPFLYLEEFFLPDVASLATAHDATDSRRRSLTGKWVRSFSSQRLHFLIPLQKTLKQTNLKCMPLSRFKICK